MSNSQHGSCTQQTAANGHTHLQHFQSLLYRYLFEVDFLPCGSFGHNSIIYVDLGVSSIFLGDVSSIGNVRRNVLLATLLTYGMQLMLEHAWPDNVERVVFNDGGQQSVRKQQQPVPFKGWPSPLPAIVSLLNQHQG